MPQTSIQPEPQRPSYSERVCAQCMGHRYLCGMKPCPLLMRAKALVNIDTAVKDLSLLGSSPPGVFIGERGYPKVLVGPLVPPVLGEETAIMEQPDSWLDRTMDDIIKMRFSLIRTKSVVPVKSAADPPRFLHETQTMALSEKPIDSEALLLKRPTFSSVISGRTLPLGPSAPLDDFRLDDNPSVPKVVDRVTSDTDARTRVGIMELFDADISRQHIQRLFSVGLLGDIRDRRLVPTKWSITAVDDIIGRQLHKEALRLSIQNDYEVFADEAHGNVVVLLFLPSAWQYEALECWLTGRNLKVIQDDEWYSGRKDYAKLVAGAYYAARLPVLKHMVERRRQSGVIAFLETDPKVWVPLGVWRFRSIAKRAISLGSKKFSTLDEALHEVDARLKSPINIWLEKSVVYSRFTNQTSLSDFF